MKRKVYTLSVVVLSLALLVAACGPQAPEPQQPTPEVQPTEPEVIVPGEDFLISNIAREQAPQISDEELSALVSGNTAFALELYQQLRQAEAGNLFYSPYSITLALAMTYAGARGETEIQMAETLKFSLSQESLHRAFNALDQQLRSAAQNNDDSAFRLNIANSLWGQRDYPFTQAFLDTLARNYGAGMNIVDYNQPEQARELINAWVADQTEDKIQDLIPEGAIDVLTRLVLANAIYFNAAWAYPFDVAATSLDDFHLLDGSVVQVEMMHQRENLSYLRGEGYQAVELPYLDSSMVMYVLLPDEGEFSAFERNLNADLLQEIQTGMQWTSVDLSLPRFKIESSFNLNDVLKAMGMVNAFDDQLADFTGMTEVRELYITDVVHKAFVDVNEEGTEAAAATGVVVGIVSMPAEEVEVKVDRPFVFMIVDRMSGTVLFVGSVVDPS